MQTQILKGFVVDLGFVQEESVYLMKSEPKQLENYRELRSELSDTREIGELMKNAVEALGFGDVKTEDEYECEYVNSKYIAEDISIQIYACDKRKKLEEIKEAIILDSMGLLNFQVDWYGYSTWTVMGYCVGDFMLGGHDMLEIIRNLKGKYIYIVIDTLETLNKRV